MFLVVCRPTSRKTRVVAPDMFGLTCRIGAHNSCYAHDTRLYPNSASTKISGIGIGEKQNTSLGIIQSRCHYCVQEDNSPKCPPLSIVRYSFIHLGVPRCRGENENAQTANSSKGKRILPGLRVRLTLGHRTAPFAEQHKQCPYGLIVGRAYVR